MQNTTPHRPSRLRVAAIQFLNPAPLLWDFEQPPLAQALAERYAVHYTLPAACAEQLRTGKADLGLVPIGALPSLPDVDVVPGCTIASLRQVRSIQLVLRPGLQLASVTSVAADAASRSSVAYVHLLLRDAGNTRVEFRQHPADLPAMLAGCEAALLIGDPALLALERRDHHGDFADHTWLDVAELWTASTHLPWVAAVWAVRHEALTRCGITAAELTADLVASRDHGLANIEALVTQWSPRLALPATTVRDYLSRNIHYRLDSYCIAGANLFFERAAETGLLPACTLPLLDAAAVSADVTATSGRD